MDNKLPPLRLISDRAWVTLHDCVAELGESPRQVLEHNPGYRKENKEKKKKKKKKTKGT